MHTAIDHASNPAPTLVTERAGAPAPSRPGRLEWGWIAVVALLFLTAGIWVVFAGEPLGTDESVYALRARHLVAGAEPGTYWRDLRAPGLPLLLAPVVAVGGDEAAMRLTVVLTGVAGLLLTWWTGRRWCSPLVGVAAATALAATPIYLSSATQIVPDVPGTVVGMAAILLYHESLVRSRWIAGPAVVVAWIATVARYGAPIWLGVGFGLVAAGRWEVVRRRFSHEALVAAALAAGIAAILFVPSVTGSEQAPFVDTQELNVAKYVPLQAFKDFAVQLPDALGGLLALLAVGGLVTLAAAAIRRRQGSRGGVVAVGIAVLTLVLLALSLNHGEPRYLVPVLPFLYVGAAAGVAPWLRGPRPVLLSVGLALSIGAASIAVPEARAAMETYEKIRPMRAAAREIGARTGGDCWVITGYVPQVEWYSGCDTTWFHDDGRPLRGHNDAMGGSTPIYLMLATDGKAQPEGSVLERYMTQVDGPVLAAGDRESDGLVAYVQFFEEDLD